MYHILISCMLLVSGLCVPVCDTKLHASALCSYCQNQECRGGCDVQEDAVRLREIEAQRNEEWDSIRVIERNFIARSEESIQCLSTYTSVPDGVLIETLNLVQELDLEKNRAHVR